jgi:hypothetical protein
VIFGEFDCEHTAIEHILPEYTGKAFRNDNTDIINFKNPNSMFTGGTTAEIAFRNNYIFSSDIFV